MWTLTNSKQLVTSIHVSDHRRECLKNWSRTFVNTGLECFWSCYNLRHDRRRNLLHFPRKRRFWKSFPSSSSGTCVQWTWLDSLTAARVCDQLYWNVRKWSVTESSHVCEDAPPATWRRVSCRVFVCVTTERGERKKRRTEDFGKTTGHHFHLVSLHFLHSDIQSPPWGHSTLHSLTFLLFTAGNGPITALYLQIHGHYHFTVEGGEANIRFHHKLIFVPTQKAEQRRSHTCPPPLLNVMYHAMIDIPWRNI